MLRRPTTSRPHPGRLASCAVAAAAAGGVLAFTAGTAAAHTESQYVAVPAGQEVTIDFAPTHGCSGSPTTGVSVRVPAAGATAGDVAGFTTAAEPDGDRTVLRWTGGSVPADQEGEFPITFTVPNTPGELLLFPTVQTCEVGEVAWIDGDPAGEHPAVRILVLAADATAARDIDEVPADAPGRELLGSVVDVDNPAATTIPPAPETTAAVPTTALAPTTAAAATTEPAVTTTPTSAAATTIPASSAAPSTIPDIDEDDDGSNAAPIVAVVGIGVLLVAGFGLVFRRRQR